MAIEIRKMVRDDGPAIMRILRKTPEFTPSEVVVAQEVLDSYLRDPSGSGYRVVVAHENGVVLGYICYGPTPLTQGTWDLYWEAVDAGRQGQGIGSALMRHAESDIRRAGGRLAIIETSSKPDYEKTRAFHRSRGYEQCCQIADFYAPGDHKLVFRKDLAKA